MTNGVVDPKIMLQMQGAMQAERGFARMWSAGASDTVKAAYMQSAMQKGALAAENIRNRYYKREFEQVLETRVKPLQDQLATAKDLYDKTMATTTMDVRRLVSPEEYQAKADSLGQGGPPEFQAISSKGDKAQELVPQQVAAPNAALGKEIGAAEYKESLALIDPVSMEPVPLSSPRGISILQKATNDFWGKYSSVNLELQKIMSEYQGNPYADKYSENLINQVIKQGNIATTGKTDPTQAQEWMEQRQQFEVAQEIRQQEAVSGQFALEAKEAQLNVATNEAASLLQSDSNFAGLLGKTITDKFNTGKPLTRQEQFEAASAVRTYRDLQERAIAQRVKDKIFTISPTNLPNPENWQAEMRTKDPVYKQYFGEKYANLVNNQRNAVLDMSSGERSALLQSYGATSDDIRFFEETGSVNPSIATAFEAMANSEEISFRANDAAMLRRLPELERQQPELANIIDQTVEEAIFQMKSEGIAVNEDLLRADRYRAFLELITGREAPMVHDAKTLRDVSEVRKQQRGMIVQPSEELGVQESVTNLPEETMKELLESKSPKSKNILGALLENYTKGFVSKHSSDTEKELENFSPEPFSWVSKPVFSSGGAQTAKEIANQISAENLGQRTGLAKKLGSKSFSWASKKVFD